MKFLGQAIVIKVRILVKVQLDAVAGLDVLKFFDFEFVQVLQAVLFILLDNGCDLRVIDEGCQPKFGDPLDNFIALVVEWSSQFVVLLLYL